MTVNIEDDPKGGQTAPIMKGRKINPLLWGAVLVVIGSITASGFWDAAHADALEDACKAKCRQIADAQSKEKGGLPAAQAFDACMDSCKRAASIKSEADVPGFCKAVCENALKRMNRAGNKADMKECVDRCVNEVTQKLRQAKPKK